MTGAGRLSWPAGPAGRCCRAAGHRRVVPSGPGRPSGLGCVARGGSKRPRDPSRRPVGREARIKSRTPLGPVLSCSTSGALLVREKVSWKWRRWPSEPVSPNPCQTAVTCCRVAGHPGATWAVSFSFSSLCPLLSGHASLPRPAH